MRYVAYGAAFELQRRVFVNERSLLVGVALDARCIDAYGQLGLLGFEPAVRIVTITASHCSLEDFVMEGLLEIRLGLVVAAHAKLWFTLLKHFSVALGWFFDRFGTDKCHRAWFFVVVLTSVSRMAICTADVIPPMLTSSEFVLGLLTRMAG